MLAIDFMRERAKQPLVVLDEHTLDHIRYSKECMHGNGFTYDFCPIAGDPEFLAQHGITMTGNPALSPYVRAELDS